MYKSIMPTVAALALMGAGTAFAASAPAASPPARAGWSGRHHQPPFAELKAQLKLTPAQEPAWTKVMVAMQAMHDHRQGKAMMARSGATMTAPQVFDAMAQRAEQRAAGAKALANSVEAFYAQLTPVQRAVLDTHLADARKRMMHHRHGMRGWGRHDGRMAPAAPPAGTGSH